MIVRADPAFERQHASDSLTIRAEVMDDEVSECVWRVVKMPRRKTFREKLADQKDLPRVVRISPGMAKQWGPGTIVIPAPREVDDLMKRVPKGKLVTINQIREAVAKRHGATIGCPITTGILARVAAGAAGEDEAEGKKRVTRIGAR